MVNANNVWKNKNSTIFVSSLGRNGVTIPDLRLTINSAAFNKGKIFNSIGDNFTINNKYWSETHTIGKDPTGRSFAYDILGNLRITNDIGAFGSETNANIADPQNSTIPILIIQPTNSIGDLGKEVSFAVTASCNDPIGYQWWKSPYVSESESKIIDNSKYTGSNTNLLKIKNITSSDANIQYICEIYNTKDRSKLYVNSNPASLELTVSNSSNSAFIDIGLRVYLEAAITINTMKPLLNNADAFPKSQPYNVPPWNLDHRGEINKIKDNYIDWVFVELRENLTKTLYRKSAILTVDGNILNPDGTDFSFINIDSGEYYIVVNHRNHLSIMSSQKVHIEKETKINYDFTSSPSTAYGLNSLVALDGGKYAMVAGDVDANGIINNLDFGVVANKIPMREYHQGDADMNGTVNVLDYYYINKNILRKTNLPKD